MQIVDIDKIPDGEFVTPKEDLVRLYSVSLELEAICKSKSGMGLAAAQVGLPWRLFVYWSNYPSKEQKFDYLLDCEYEPASDKKSISIEGCLSLPGRYKLTRYDEVRVFGKKINQRNSFLVLDDFDAVFSGVLAVVLQHEIDHQYGRSKMIDVIGEKFYLS